MKSVRKYVLLLGALASSLLCACTSGAGAAKPLPVSFSRMTAEEKSVLECDPKKPELNISVDLRYAADPAKPAACEAINREILKTALVPIGEKTTVRIGPDFVRSVQDYIAEEVKSYQDAWTEIYNDWGHSFGSENRIALRGNTRGIVGSTIIYSLELDRDTGGAHPIHFKYFFNFDGENGKRLTLADLFKPGYEKELTELLTRRAMTLENVSLKSKLSCEPAPTENFIVESDGILFYFNPYDIAPYSRGPISLKLRYGELSRILKGTVPSAVTGN